MSLITELGANEITFNANKKFQKDETSKNASLFLDVLPETSKAGGDANSGVCIPKPSVNTLTFSDGVDGDLSNSSIFSEHGNQAKNVLVEEIQPVKGIL